MDLYLVRHAIAHPRDEKKWPDDGKRPLTPEGEERFRRAARGLRKLTPTVELVLASPFDRAWRTAELLNEEARWPQPKKCEVIEADRSPVEGIEALRGHLDVASVALVGHEPNLSEIASMLLTGNATRLAMDFKKGGAACLQLDGSLRRGSAMLLWFVTPRMLRSLAG
ncbi:MAG: phosphohistidine phosphatase SixA [Actinomycetota bacterium]